jgi:small subunit ribosomal protein S1
MGNPVLVIYYLVAQSIAQTYRSMLSPISIMTTTTTNDTTAEAQAMDNIFETTETPPAVGEIVEGPVIDIDKASVYIDLHPHGTGIIYGREFNQARHMIRNLNSGDDVAAKVVERENEQGYVELSLKEARQAIVWGEAEEAMEEEEVFELPVKDANKGGLLLEWQGVQGFLPASQLKPEHYPRVEGGDKDKILRELKDLVGENLSVSIITADAEEGKLIFSEKSPAEQEREEIIEEYEEDDIIEGEITGIVDFGVFIKVEEGLEGLAHISELDWGLVDDPRDMFEVGEKVRAKIIEIDEGKISLSIKSLKENPWEDAAEKYGEGQNVDGVIIKFNEHGALAAIEEGVAGLVHVSEFESQEELRDTLELGKTYPFTITLFNPDDRRMALSYVGDETDEEE